MAEAQGGREFYFIANYLCLDFVNTEVVKNGEMVDLLGSFDDLLAWSVAAGMLAAAQAGVLFANWGDRRETGKVLERARELRAGLREMAERVVSGRTVSQSILDQINEAQSKHAGRFVIARVKGALVKSFDRSFDEPAHLLVPVAESASDLLSAGDLALVKRCENPACVLYFYDTTKNHARRWCSMSACGNRMKVAAYYRRTKSR